MYVQCLDKEQKLKGTTSQGLQFTNAAISVAETDLHIGLQYCAMPISVISS
jgi:hypothetical protein